MSLHGTVDVRVSGGDDAVTVFVTNYAMSRHPIVSESVRVRLDGAPLLVTAFLSRIDDDHANPRRAWQEMGEPTYPSPRQVETLQAASALRPTVHPLHATVGRLQIELAMPPQSVAALRIELARS